MALKVRTNRGCSVIVKPTSECVILVLMLMTANLWNHSRQRRFERGLCSGRPAVRGGQTLWPKSGWCRDFTILTEWQSNFDGRDVGYAHVCINVNVFVVCSRLRNADHIESGLHRSSTFSCAQRRWASILLLDASLSAKPSLRISNQSRSAKRRANSSTGYTCLRCVSLIMCLYVLRTRADNSLFITI
jgi:hypothetical protein